MNNFCAIVVPVVSERLSEQEAVSLGCLKQKGKNYQKVIICPMSLNFDFDTSGFRIKRLDDKYFESIGSYNNLMLTSDFYCLFEDYSFILIYQLDCLMFKEELHYWCSLDYSYIGAPFYYRGTVKPKGVGNGGFSLRKVSDFLKVLKSQKISLFPSSQNNFRYFVQHKPLKRLIKIFLDKGNIEDRFKKSGLAEDNLWSYYATQADRSFRLAPPKEALLFAFEDRPADAYKEAGYQLPFGCHAWFKKDKEFWEQKLKEQGFL